MKVSLGCDHGAYDLKELIKEHLTKRGIEVVDCGCYDKSSCDYPNFGRPAAEAVANKECDFGILMCTTGIGMSMVANKVKGVRAALVSDSLSASLTRQHNNANVLVLGAGIVGSNLALAIVDTFLDTPFSNEERHQRRIDLIEG